MKSLYLFDIIIVKYKLNFNINECKYWGKTK